MKLEKNKAVTVIFFIGVIFLIIGGLYLENNINSLWNQKPTSYTTTLVDLEEKSSYYAFSDTIRINNKSTKTIWIDEKMLVALKEKYHSNLEIVVKPQQDSLLQINSNGSYSIGAQNIVVINAGLLAAFHHADSESTTNNGITIKEASNTGLYEACVLLRLSEIQFQQYQAEYSLPDLDVDKYKALLKVLDKNGIYNVPIRLEYPDVPIRNLPLPEISE